MRYKKGNVAQVEFYNIDEEFLPVILYTHAIFIDSTGVRMANIPFMVQAKIFNGLIS